MSKEKPITLEAGFTSTETDGVVTLKYNDESAYKSGTDIPATTLKAVADYNQSFIETTTTAAADEAKKLMTGNKAIEKVIVEFPYTTSARGNISVTVNRAKTYPGMNGGPEVTKSAIAVAVKDPYAKIKSTVKDLEKSLTTALLG